MITLGENGYITVEQFKTWCNARLIEFFAYNDLQIEAAIVVASVDFIDTNYTFKGCKLDEAQSMSLPTDDVAIADIQNAVAQAVWQQLRGLLFTPELTSNEGEVLRKREKVGPIEEETEYREGSVRSYTYSTTKIDRLIAPHVIGNAGGLSILRG